MGNAVLTLALIVGLVTVLPGSDFALVLRSATALGWRPGVFTALGIAAGLVTWGIATAIGLSALLAALPATLTALRIFGGIYLVSLGVRTALALRAQPAAASDISPPEPGLGWRWASVRSGAIANLLNPKIGVFYLSVVPGLLPPHSSVLLLTLLVTGIHAAETIAWLSFVAALIDRMRRLVTRPGVLRATQYLTAGALIVLGGALVCNLI